MKFSNIFTMAIIFMLATTASFAQTATTETAQVTETTKTITTKVKGVTCGDDVKTLAANIEKLAGVTSCKAGKKGPTTSFEVTFNPALVSEKEIQDAIQNTGGCKNPNDRPYTVKL
jgi:copper chaperone CopZ